MTSISGTTLVQEITWLIRHDADVTEANKESTFNRVPFLEYYYPPTDEVTGLEHANGAPRPRHLKTHLPYSLIPEQAKAGKCKTIYVMRNPKDALVSYYFFYKSLVTFGKFKGTWDQFFQMFLVDNIYWGNIFDHFLGWWENRDNPNIYFVKYEDIINNQREEIAKIVRFCDRELTDEKLDIITEATAFKTMKANPMTNAMNFTKEIDSKVSPFMRKGVAGDWKNHFSREQNEIMDKLIEERLRGTGLEFFYGS
jgi:hypothetical protein